MDKSRDKPKGIVSYSVSCGKKTLEIERRIARNASKAFEAYAKSRIQRA